MPKSAKSPKKAKRVNWKAYARHCEAVIDIQIDVERARTEHANRLIRERTAWEEAAARHCRNEEFYRNLVAKIGKPFGAAAKTSDDGSVQQDVLALKVPELVEALRHNYQDWRQRAEAAERHNAELLREVEELKIVIRQTGAPYIVYDSLQTGRVDVVNSCTVAAIQAKPSRWQRFKAWIGLTGE